MGYRLYRPAYTGTCPTCSRCWGGPPTRAMYTGKAKLYINIYIYIYIYIKVCIMYVFCTNTCGRCWGDSPISGMYRGEEELVIVMHLYASKYAHTLFLIISECVLYVCLFILHMYMCIYLYIYMSRMFSCICIVYMKTCTFIYMHIFIYIQEPEITLKRISASSLGDIAKHSPELAQVRYIYEYKCMLVIIYEYIAKHSPEVAQVHD
jgi:hypothetical protein